MNSTIQKLSIDRMLVIQPAIEKFFPKDVSQELYNGLNAIVNDKNSSENGKLVAFIKRCCDYKLTKFTEFVPYAMIAIGINMIKLPTFTDISDHQTKLLAHVFHADFGDFSSDFKKV